MSISELINEIISEWAYRVNDGMPDAKNPKHLKELGIVLKEMGLSHIKDTLVENLLNEKSPAPKEIEEADKNFTNPILNKKVTYKNDKGENKEGIVGNLLRQPEGTPARDAAEKMLPPEGSPEREDLNQELGGEGQAKKPEDGKEKAGGEEGGAPKEDPIKAAAPMFDPKVDPAMGARMDREQEANAKIAADDAKNDNAEEESNPLDAKFNPIEIQDVAKEMPQADTDTFSGGSDIPDAIDPKELEQFNTDINKVAKQVADAKAKGEQAPNINLCGVTVPGTNLYCDDNLGIPRSEMPQFKGTAQPGSRAAGMDADASGEVDTEPVFKEMLKEKGIKTLQTQVPADKLKATQSELVGAKVVGMMGALEKDPNHPKITAPIYVSRDGYVIDGHHRWAAIVAYNAQNPDKQIQMKTTVLDMDIKDAIPMANKFAEDMGIAAKKADANKEDATQPKAAEVKPNESDPTSNVKTFKGESSGKEVKTVELEGGGLLFGTQHGDTKMADDIINQVKATIPKERWKDIVFVGEGGATGNSGELEFNDEMKYSAPKFKEMGAEIDTWDGDAMDVHNSESKLYQKQKEKTGLNDNQILAGNWASMIGQGEGQGLDPNDPDNNMKAEDYLDDDGKQFLQDAAKEAGLPPIENFDNPTGEKPSEENGWKGTGDRGTLYRLAFPDDNGDKPTKINDIQVAFNEARDENLIEKNKELTAKGKIPVVMAGESHADLVDNIMKGNKKENPQKEMKEENLQLAHELMLEMIYGFIDEATYPKSDDGKFWVKGKSNGNVYTVIKPKPALHDVPTKTDLKKVQADTKPEEPTQNLAPTDFRPTPDMEQPNTTPTTTKKKKGKKNKELDQRKNTKGEFNEGNLSKDGVTDEQFAANKKIKPAPSQIKVSQIEKFFLDKKGNTKFPKKYIKVLARMLSTKPGGVTISDFTDASGAGTLSSTMGELLTLMAVTIKDNNEAKEFFGMLREHIKVNGKDSIIDIGWVNSAEKVRQTQFNRYDRKYGRGNWELDNMAWDVESEVEAMGMENYKQNKGFSTDVYAKVKVGGKYILDEISLKKEIKANLLNATSGRVADIMVRGLASDEDLVVYDDLNAKIDSLMGLKDAASKKEKAELVAQRDAIVEKYNVNVPDDVKVSKVQKKQRLLHEDFVKKGVSEVSGFLKKFCNKKDTKYRNGALNTMKNALSQKDDYKPKVNEQLDSLCSIMPKGGFKTPEDYNNALKQLKIGDTSDIQKLNMGLMSAIAAENPQSQAAKSSKMIIKNSHNHSKAVREFLLKDPAARKGLLGSIREAFPLKALFEGEENMILGDVSVDKDVLTNVFGVDSYDQLEQKLTVRDTPPPPSIVYRVAGREDIPVAEIVSRPDGIGYGGSWKLIMAVHPDFAKKLKESNDVLNSRIK